MNNRTYVLDALRGYAVITMVPSTIIVTQVPPDRMSHTQAPPPDRIFNPSSPDITWVGLVFPFLLFAMGAALPFSIGKRVEKGNSKLKLICEAVKREIQLAFFAIFIQHFYPYALSSPQDIRAWLLVILCFVVLLPMFMCIPLKVPDWAHTGVRIAACGIAAIMMLTTSHADGKTFSLYFNNVTILLLANTTIFGSVLYIFTMHNRWLRLRVLLLLMAVILGSIVESSWTQVIFNYIPLPWMYRLGYLKHLFIVIPGSIAGKYLMEWMKSRKDTEQPASPQYRKIEIALLILTMVIIIFNLYGLYIRMMTMSLLATFVLLLISELVFLRPTEGIVLLWKKLFNAGTYLLLLGLCFEPFQKGIKKDPATFSYFFVIPGPAFLALLFSGIVCDCFRRVRSSRFLTMSGQGPVTAYVAGDLFIMSLVNILELIPLLSYFQQNAWLGFPQGAIITSLAVLVTMFFTKIKWS